MVYKLFYTQSAEKDLAHLSKKTVSRVIKKINEYSQHKTPLKFAKKLKGITKTTYRFRIGDYRAIFRLDPQTKQLIILVILKIAHRRDVYN